MRVTGSESIVKRLEQGQRSFSFSAQVRGVVQIHGSIKGRSWLWVILWEGRSQTTVISDGWTRREARSLPRSSKHWQRKWVWSTTICRVVWSAPPLLWLWCRLVLVPHWFLHALGLVLWHIPFFCTSHSEWPEGAIRPRRMCNRCACQHCGIRYCTCDLVSATPRCPAHSSSSDGMTHEAYHSCWTILQMGCECSLQ